MRKAKTEQDPAVGQPRLVISAKSWQKDSFALFDHETKDLIKQQLLIKQTCKLVWFFRLFSHDLAERRATAQEFLVPKTESQLEFIPRGP